MIEGVKMMSNIKKIRFTLAMGIVVISLFHLATVVQKTDIALVVIGMMKSNHS